MKKMKSLRQAVISTVSSKDFFSPEMNWLKCTNALGLFKPLLVESQSKTRQQGVVFRDK